VDKPFVAQDALQLRADLFGRQAVERRLGPLFHKSFPRSQAQTVATGQGVTNPASATGAAPGRVLPVPVALASVRIGDRPAQLLFSGQTPGTAGVMQLNVQVPTGTSPGNAAVVLRVDPAESQPGVAIPVR
jgi:uncharacterized protein (TIGR03437 family)